MPVLRIKPILGLKNDVPENDPSLFQWIAKNYALTHQTAGYNLDYTRQKNACSKAYGRHQWSNSAIGSPTGCNGLFELDDGTNINHVILDHGKFYYYDSSYDPTNIDASPAVTFNTTSPALYSLIQFSDYIVIADGLRTPYKWKHGDANLTKLILGGGATEYVFKYLLEFQRRIIGAYSDQTNGDIEIRWTDALPTIASLDFPSANQLYKPYESDPITGISKMGANAAYLYGEKSICRIDYYPGAAIPLGITQTITGHGSVNHHSIINDGYANYFFDKNYGFIKYQGEYEIKKENIISRNVEKFIDDISSNYQNLIVGTIIPFSDEICWAIPRNSATNNVLLFYNTKTGQWREVWFAARYIDIWTPFTSYTWTILNTNYSTWTAAYAALGNWGLITRQLPYLMMSKTDGHVYTHSGETDNTANLYSTWTDPVMDFGDPIRKKRVLEIWLGIVSGGDYSIDVYWATGDTLKEVAEASSSYLGSINLNNPDNAVLYVDQVARYHQATWVSNEKDEPFAINELMIKYQTQGEY